MLPTRAKCCRCCRRPGGASVLHHSPLASGSCYPSIRRPVSVKGRMTSSRERHILVLYTGGTLGMVRDDRNVLVPIPNMFTKALKSYPNMHDSTYKSKCLCKTNTLALPMTGSGLRILYTIVEYDPLLDSSNMSPKVWLRVAFDIKNAYENYDGFVVLHGTDTLAYTASALSFILENLGKCVVVTGAQLSIFEPFNDGLENILGAITLAGSCTIPEVTVFFHKKLFRGNRTTKLSTNTFDAFDSPNFPPLATFGFTIEVNEESIQKFPPPSARLKINDHLNSNICLLPLHPMLDANQVLNLLDRPVSGIILQSYGAGNVPNVLLEAFRKVVKSGVLVLNITKCIYGSVNSNLYATGLDLHEIGVTFGLDLTEEAAVAKMAYVLSLRELDFCDKQKILQQNLRGELTTMIV